MKTITRFFTNLFLIVIPMLTGGLLYIFYRPLNLKMFSWLDSLHLLKFVIQTREVINKNIFFPNWIVYSLPNALWVFSGIITFQMIWKRNIKQLMFWVSLFTFIAIMFEVLQVNHIIPGKYDLNDIVLIVISATLANIYYFWLLKQEDI